MFDKCKGQMKCQLLLYSRGRHSDKPGEERLKHLLEKNNKLINKKPSV